jgi:hypothetical protein
LETDRHRPVREALAAGDLLVAQARVITEAVDAMPADLVEEQLRDRVEKHLVVLAGEHDAKALRILGQRVLEVLAPEIAEEVERRLLEQEERRARETARFSMSADGHGSVHGRFKIPALEGAMLRKHLEAIAAPRHRAATGDTGSAGADGAADTADADGADGADGAAGVSGGAVSRPLRMGQAFCEYLRTRDRQGTPQAGGVAATVTVTMSLAALLGAEAAAGLDTGERISAAEARRLACEAGIIPVVLGGRSEPLDVGRTRRFHTRAQRVAIGLRDGGCAADGCDWPPGMCHVHHQTPWSRGGRTNVADAMMLCPRHHTIAHDARYQLKTGPTGKVTFTRRT